MNKQQMVLSESLEALAYEIRVLTGFSPLPRLHGKEVSIYDVKGTARVNINMIEKYLKVAKELAK